MNIEAISNARQVIIDLVKDDWTSAEWVVASINREFDIPDQVGCVTKEDRPQLYVRCF